MYQPGTAGGFPLAVRPSEIAIVGIVLCVWATAVYVFINQWGKPSIPNVPPMLFGFLVEHHKHVNKVLNDFHQHFYT